MSTNKSLRSASAWLSAGLVFLCAPSQAQAHLVTTGMGPVYDGIGHLLMTPEDVIPAIAIAFYAGLRGAVAGRRTMFMLPLAWFVGGLIGPTLNITTSSFIAPISFLILGGIVALDIDMPHAAVISLTIALGLTNGFRNGATLREGAGVLGLVGIMAILFVLVTLISAVVVSLEKSWMRKAVRVAGSWVAAVGLLMVGWAMR